MNKQSLNTLLHNFDLSGVIQYRDYVQNRVNKMDYIYDIRPNFRDRFGDYKRFKYAKSIIVVAMSFNQSSGYNHSSSVMADFAKGKDYHQVMQTEIEQVIEHLKELNPENKYEYTVDIGALDEKYAAVLAGIGQIGKNGLLISKQYGSRIVLGTIITDDTFDEYDLYPEQDICKGCKKCIEACPVGAINHGYFEQNSCLSGLLQSKKMIKKDIIDKVDNMLYGCDICQNVCPYNTNTIKSKREEFEPDSLATIDIDWLFGLSEEDYKKEFKDKAINWVGYPIVLRNAIINHVNRNHDNIKTYIEQTLDKYSELSYMKRTMEECLNFIKNKE